MLTDEQRAAAFVAANKESPVVSGYATGPAKEPTGCCYRLKDGRTFRLTSEQCKLAGYPRWDLPDAD